MSCPCGGKDGVGEDVVKVSKGRSGGEQYARYSVAAPSAYRQQEHSTATLRTHCPALEGYSGATYPGPAQAGGTGRPPPHGVAPSRWRSSPALQLLLVCARWDCPGETGSGSPASQRRAQHGARSTAANLLSAKPPQSAATQASSIDYRVQGILATPGAAAVRKLSLPQPERCAEALLRCTACL